MEQAGVCAALIILVELTGSGEKADCDEVDM